MRRKHLVQAVLGAMTAMLLLSPVRALADDELDAANKEKTIAEAKLAILKLQAEVDKGKADAIKATVDAETARATAKTTRDLATATALKDIYGAPKAVGQGGAVTAAEKEMPFLLWSRVGDVALLEEAAEAMCGKAGPELMLVPADLTARRQVLHSFDSVMALLTKNATEMEKNLDPTSKSFSAAMGLVTVGLYAMNAVSDLVKSLRTDRAIAVSAISRADVFERIVLGSNVCKNVAAVDWQTAALAKSDKQFQTRNSQLETLREAYGKWSTWKTQAEEALKKAQAALEEAKKNKKKGDAAAVEAAQTRLNTVLAYTWLTDSIKKVLDAVSSESVMQLAETAALLELLGNKAGLTYSLTVHDLQINASGFFGKSLRRVPMVELQYTVTGLDGRIKRTGYFAKKGVEQTIGWDKEEPATTFSYGR